jgi:hypothetical protein
MAGTTSGVVTPLVAVDEAGAVTVAVLTELAVVTLTTWLAVV